MPVALTRRTNGKSLGTFKETKNKQMSLCMFEAHWQKNSSKSRIWRTKHFQFLFFPYGEQGDLCIYKYHWGAFMSPLWECKSNKYMFWAFICSLRYPACNAHAPYRHLWPAPYWHLWPALYCHLWPATSVICDLRHTIICDLPDSTIFLPQYHINCTIFERKLLNTKRVFRFSLQLLSETFFILIKTERGIIINVLRCSCKVLQYFTEIVKLYY